jgi:mitochondrial import inner membrane translocase subunit TIM50
VSHEIRDLPPAPNSTIKLPSNTQYSPSSQLRAAQGAGIKPSPVSNLRNQAAALPVAGLRSSSSTDNAKPLDASEPPPSSAATSAPPSSFSSPIENSETKSEPLPPLPDLTRGIPSTLDSEIAEASSGSRPNAAGLDITEDPSNASAGSRRGADLPNSAYISSLERRRNRIANFMYASILGFSIFGTLYLGRNWDTEDEEIKHPDAPSGWGLGLFYNRAHARLRDMLDYYNEPAFPKLLPKPDPMMERPYTLVLSLEDLLVHSEWTREHGWRSAKRPGVDYFLRYLSQYYELVVFTSVASMNAEPIIRKLDPFRIITWPLFREATRFKDGTYIKVGTADYLVR